jgi:hypothetical protein
VLVAVIGILVYKAASAKPSAASETAAGNESGFSVAPAPTESEAPDAEYGPPAPQPAAPPVKAPTSIGESLGSLSDLNKVAMNQDAVFVFIPGGKGDAVKAETSEAVRAAQTSLKRSNITLGLYTLAAGTPEYARMAQQVQAPAILVACKGRGMAAVSGDVTETKLLQAFMASSRAGGCCPPGSGATCD